MIRSGTREVRDFIYKYLGSDYHRVHNVICDLEILDVETIGTHMFFKRICDPGKMVHNVPDIACVPPHIVNVVARISCHYFCWNLPPAKVNCV